MVLALFIVICIGIIGAMAWCEREFDKTHVCTIPDDTAYPDDFPTDPTYSYVGAAHRSMP